VLDELAATCLNSRQIRNMVRTSYAIAASTDSVLTAQHLSRTLRAIAEFESEVNENLLSTKVHGSETHLGDTNKRQRLE
jgi:hypothetical protein